MFTARMLCYTVSRFLSICFTISGAKNIVRYTEDFVIWRFVKLSSHCK